MKVLTEIIIVVLFLLAGYLVWKNYNDNKIAQQVIEQNEKAFNDSLKIIGNGWQQRYAQIKNIYDREAKERDEEILAQAKTIVKLKNIISESVADTVTIIDSSGNVTAMEASFRDTTDFYVMDLFVRLSINKSLSYQKHEMKFVPFAVVVNFSRNKKGEYFGNVKVEEEHLRDVINISDAEFIFGKDEFIRIEEDINKFRMDLMPSVAVYSFNQIYIGVGLNAIINKKYLVGVHKTISHNYYAFLFGYSFSIIK